MIHLIVKDGKLNVPNAMVHDKSTLWEADEDVLLIVRYPEGDCDTIAWPLKDETKLQHALYDCRETGILPPNANAVLLPDGREFPIDG